MKKFLLSIIAILILICAYQVGVSYGSPKHADSNTADKQYILIRSSNQKDLEKEVTKRMREENFTPIGGPFVQEGYLYQAMIR